MATSPRPAAPSAAGTPAVVLPDAKKVQATLSKVIEKLGSSYGKGFAVRLREEGAYAEVKRVVPTGLPSLDAALGVGGLPLGKITEIYGPEHCLKSTLSKLLAARAQLVGVVPNEYDLEVSGARLHDEALGINRDNALISQPDSMEEVMGSMLMSIPIFQKDRISALYIWDSLAATYMAAELDEGAEEDARGYPARALYLAKNLPKLVRLLKNDEHGSVGVVIVNQVRQKIGAPSFARQTDSPGGRALRHAAHVRIEMSPRGMIKRGDAAIGIKAMARIIKNKVSKPFGEALLGYYFEDSRLVDLTHGGGEDTAARPKRTPMVLSQE